MTIQSITVDATGPAVSINNRDSAHEASASALRDVVIVATGGFGGGTLKIQRQDSAGTWYDVPGASYTDVFAKRMTDNIITQYRYVMTGSTTPTVTIRFT